MGTGNAAVQPPPKLSQSVVHGRSSPFLQVHSTFATYILLQYWMSLLDLMGLSSELD